MQLKAIFSVLLRDWEFEMAQPSETYRDDCSKMVIQLEQPCRVPVPQRAGFGAADVSGGAHEGRRRPDLCQAHQMCQAEAPDVFGFDEAADQVVVLVEHPRRVAARRGRARPCATARRWRSSTGGGLMSYRASAMEEFWERLARGQPGGGAPARLGAPGRPLRRGRDVRVDVHPRRALHGGRPRGDPEATRSAPRWPGSTAGTTTTSRP